MTSIVTVQHLLKAKAALVPTRLSAGVRQVDGVNG